MASRSRLFKSALDPDFITRCGAKTLVCAGDFPRRNFWEHLLEGDFAARNQRGRRPTTPAEEETEWKK